MSIDFFCKKTFSIHYIYRKIIIYYNFIIVTQKFQLYCILSMRVYIWYIVFLRVYFLSKLFFRLFKLHQHLLNFVLQLVKCWKKSNLVYCYHNLSLLNFVIILFIAQKPFFNFFIVFNLFVQFLLFVLL